MSKYKKLEINDRILYYKQYWCSHPDVDELYTKFYIIGGRISEKKWSWRKFKKVRTGKRIRIYSFKFELELDIESPEYTKSHIRNKLEHYLELLGREEEIKKGEIV